MASKALLWGGAALAALAFLSARSGSEGNRQDADPTPPPPDKPSKDRTYYDPAVPGNDVEIRSDRGWAPPMKIDEKGDRAWAAAYLTEYHPDAPAHKRKLEGGPNDRHPGIDKHPVISWEQHAADPKTYPFVTVASDLELRGCKVPYGARLYLESYPDVEFRLMDTGSHFFGKGKVIRKPGHEPFDVATKYQTDAGARLHISGKQTRYWVDFGDVTEYPSWLVVQRARSRVA